MKTKREEFKKEVAATALELVKSFTPKSVIFDNTLSFLLYEICIDYASDEYEVEEYTLLAEKVLEKVCIEVCKPNLDDEVNIIFTNVVGASVYLQVNFKAKEVSETSLYNL